MANDNDSTKNFESIMGEMVKMRIKMKCGLMINLS